MTTLNNILNNITQQQISTDIGTKIHAILQHITIDDKHTIGNIDYINKIKQTPELSRFFTKDSKTESASNVNISFNLKGENNGANISAKNII